jgi:hypothetical protein
MANTIVRNHIERLAAELLERRIVERIHSAKLTSAGGVLDHLAYSNDLGGLPPMVSAVARAFLDLLKRPSVHTGWPEGTGTLLLSGTAPMMVSLIAQIVVNFESDLEWRVLNLIRELPAVQSASAKALMVTESEELVREFITPNDLKEVTVVES